MKGDFTRLGFDPAQTFSRVLMQQGRVQLDSDWNEKQEMDLYHARTALQDVASFSGVPAGGAGGFAIGLTPAGNDLTIASGRLYAGGLLCENNFANATLSLQPFLALATPTLPGLAWPTPKGIARYLVYLDVWERDLSALEVPAIRETALGGPDTATRTRLIWQVRLEPATAGLGSEDFPPGWMPAALAPAGGQMLAATAAAGAGSGPCVLPPTALYTSLSNQLYRVEIHDSGSMPPPAAGPAPTFKWSRENASVATLVTAIAGQSLTVADLGPDDTLNFQPGQAVEIVDERLALSGQAGVLLLVQGVDTLTNIITIAAVTSVPAGLDTTQPILLRRWDQPGVPGAGAQTLPVAAGPIALEAGLTVSFAPGFYRAGDYWTFPARTAIDAETGNIVWPAPPGTYLPPQGVAHQYVPLALVDYVPPSPVQAGAVGPMGRFILVEDCRRLFAPMAGRLSPLHARFASNGHLARLQPGQQLRLDMFAQGVMLATGQPLDASSVSAGSVRLVAEVPVALNQLIPGSADGRLGGSVSVALASSVSLATRNRIVVTPSPAALDLMAAAMARRLSSGTQQDFTHQFITWDFAPPPLNAQWVVNDDGTLGQTNKLVANQAGAPLIMPSIAVSTTASTTPLAHVGASFRSTLPAGQTTYGDAGLVFNWSSNADFWVFYSSYVSVSVGFSGGFSAAQSFVQHIVNGSVAASFTSPQIQGSSSPPFGATDLDIGLSNAGLTFNATVHPAAGSPFVLTISPPAPTPAAAPAAAAASAGGVSASARIGLQPAVTQRLLGSSPAVTEASRTNLLQSIVGVRPIGTPIFDPQPAAPAPAQPTGYPTAFLPGTRAGVMIRARNDVVFTRLQWSDEHDGQVNLLPIGGSGPILVRMIVKPSLLRTMAEAQAIEQGALPTPPAPEPDFETSFFVTAAAYGYYGYGMGLPGIGADQL